MSGRDQEGTSDMTGSLCKGPNTTYLQGAEGLCNKILGANEDVQARKVRVHYHSRSNQTGPGPR